MKRTCLLIMAWMSVTCLHAAEKKEERPPARPQAVMFTAPKNWNYVAANELPDKVKVMVVGKSKKGYPPSMNLGVEEYKGTTKEYLKIVKRINDEQGGDWKDLGQVRTAAGCASLSQLDTRTEWGWVRMMHIILCKDGAAYILTAASLRDEFSDHYSDFFKTMRSLRFGDMPDEEREIADRY